jgi:hypothetical protein
VNEITAESDGARSSAVYRNVNSMRPTDDGWPAQSKERRQFFDGRSSGGLSAAFELLQSLPLSIRIAVVVIRRFAGFGRGVRH